MQKVSKHILAVSGRILFIGLSLQMVLGVLWICCNFGRFQEFGDSLFYIEVSKSMVFDEYTGALYPVLLMLVRGIEELLRIPYTFMIHLLQLAVAGYAGWRFLRAFGGRNRLFLMWGSLVLLTFPMVAQCHLAVLPNSGALSMFMLELSVGVEVVRNKSAVSYKQLCKMNLFWLLSALLLPDYFYFGAVPVVLLWLYHLCRCRKQAEPGKQAGMRLVYHLVLVAAFTGMIAGIGSLIQQEGAYGRPAKTLDAALFRRMTWTSLYDTYDEWPAEMQEACPFAVMMETTEYADHMELIFQPRLETAVGREKAQQYYREVWQLALSYNKGGIIRETAWDAVSYMLPPFAAKLLLEGRGYDSYVGRNYETMKNEAPVLTKYYMDYSAWWLLVGLVVALLAEAALLLHKEKRNGFSGKNHWMSIVLCVIPAGIFVLWYTLQGAGVWDYKNGVFAGLLWIIWMVSVVCRGMQEEGC